MLRFALVLGGLCLAPCAQVYADPPALTPEEKAFRETLAIKKAVVLAEHYLRVDETQKAVDALEEQVAKIQNDTNFMRLLLQAYRMHIKHLTLANQPDVAKRYIDRLAILDPESVHQPEFRTPLKIDPKQANNQPLPDFASRHPAPEPDKNVLTPSSIAPQSVLGQTSSARGPQLQGETHSPNVVRAKPDDPQDDPFDLANQRKPSLVPSLAAHSPPRSNYLAQADEEFQKGRYVQAKQLYEAAYHADQKTLEQFRKPYAYCLLDQVVNALNRTPGKVEGPDELSRQVQQALQLAHDLPDLQAQGKGLLKEIDQRRSGPMPDEASIGLQHLGRNPQGWLVTETTHFRIFHQQQKEYVEKVALIAERTRVLMSRKWFNQETGAWTPKCELVLHATGSDYSAMTKVPATSPGHSRIESDPGTQRVIGRRMDLRVDNPHLLEAVLPHETTHVVLAGNFGPYPVPRWADEGIAVLSEPLAKIEQHRQNVAKAASEQKLFSISELVHLSDYPEPRRLEAFYAQSVMLADFLAQRRGPAVLVQFIRDGLKEGYETSLRRHYDMDFATLQQQWTAQVVHGTQQASLRK
jgi:tetratricopeptide (TPR) repeat protein